ncbi:DUF3519 domain-containing protein [Helicobacter pylori]|nr:DUF3519 domain-containing protein [Helicobacter pylori]MDO7808834.1 DUF3519 domain-containing protein [Helicobacter pylori]MDO7815328.1 DUF3519 domain-containing protein [Helicobacter pylori]MDO7819871.1 DUF3519 domain-containing protein [Helicobacter pylori]MDO7827983.1 DUF3519 domain-containing protein [Helicobacter pylori]MDO7866657.1 DUF3519 domain-containing protein [Helicobacter pylori]
MIDDLNNGNKIFDFYSGRNFTDFRDARPLPSTLIQRDTISKRFNKSRGLLKNTENLNELTPKTLKF